MAITERDILIFKVLSSGPAKLSVIKDLLTKIYKEDIDSEALRVRLYALRQQKYVQAKRYVPRGIVKLRYKDKKLRQEGMTNKEGSQNKRQMMAQNKLNGWGHTLYALTEGAVEWLGMVGYTRDKIRIGLPGQFFVAHELMVTDIVRAVKREASQLRYDFQIYDENTIRALDFGKKHKSFPDLVVILRFIVDGQYKMRTVAVEIDNDTEVPAAVFVKMIKHIEPIILVLCPTSQRIVKLQQFIIKQTDFDLMHKVFFGNVNDFSANGFFDSELLTIVNSPANFIPRKGKLQPYTEEVL